MDGTKTCFKCGYTWKPRVKNPKECPRCKRRQDDREIPGGPGA